jgi:aminopeptidase N
VHIEAIIAHEYFHNWTGNRITCRDWFQLCLKEGLTVFRDQEFTSDLRSRAVKRIQDVRTLRSHQFPEDAGRWRIRSVRNPILKSTTSTPRPCMKKAQKWCA